MSKIRLNEQYFRELSSGIKDDQIIAVGFFGDYKKSLHAAH
jgi:hypothetical protein